MTSTASSSAVKVAVPPVIEPGTTPVSVVEEIPPSAVRLTWAAAPAATFPTPIMRFGVSTAVVTSARTMVTAPDD